MVACLVGRCSFRWPSPRTAAIPRWALRRDVRTTPPTRVLAFQVRRSVSLGLARSCFTCLGLGIGYRAGASRTARLGTRNFFSSVWRHSSSRGAQPLIYSHPEILSVTELCGRDLLRGWQKMCRRTLANGARAICYVRIETNAWEKHIFDYVCALTGPGRWLQSRAVFRRKQEGARRYQRGTHPCSAQSRRRIPKKIVIAATRP